MEVLKASETRTFEYDDLGRVLKTTQTSPSIYGKAVFGRNRYAGQSGSRSYEYDALDRVTKMTFEDGKTMEYFYDQESNVIEIIENASSTTPKVTQFLYYGDNKLYQVTYVRTAGNQVFTYAYDPGGRPLTLTYPTSTGIVAHFTGPSSEVGWDGNGQLLHLRYMKGADTVRRFEFSYDDAGNRISQLDVKGVGTTKATKWEYAYDWLDRLEAVKKAEASTVGGLGALQLVAVYEYDTADNRTEFQVPNLDPNLTETFRYSYDFADNITLIEKKVGSGSYASFETFTPADDDGNMTSRTRGGVTTTYKWDDFNRLAAISTSDNSKKQSHTFGVSGFRRKKKDKNDVETTEYAAGLATAVSKATGGETITYLMGHRLMGFERSSDGATFWFITDSLSTVRDLINSSGSVVASYEFSEYGQRIASSESGVSSQKTWVGGLSVQDEVADTGLMMMGHRFYDPSGPAGGTGRFLNRDPIGFAGGLNLFEYASSPIQFTDPRGLQPWDPDGWSGMGYPADPENKAIYLDGLKPKRSQAVDMLFGTVALTLLGAGWARWWFTNPLAATTTAGAVAQGVAGVPAGTSLLPVPPISRGQALTRGYASRCSPAPHSPYPGGSYVTNQVNLGGAHIVNKTGKIGSRAVVDSIIDEGAIRTGYPMMGEGVYFHPPANVQNYQQFPHVLFDTTVSTEQLIIHKSGSDAYYQVRRGGVDLPVRNVRGVNLD